MVVGRGYKSWVVGVGVGVSNITNPLTAVGALRALIDFTLSNARGFYSSMGDPLAVKNVPIKSTHKK